ncbi:MAG: 3-oxoacyl-ACP synthase, partial [Algoriella sp.]
MEVDFTKRIYAQISAIGGYVPENRRTNSDLEKITETSDEWIVKRTGIKERRILEDGLATSDMAVSAILNLIETYQKDIQDVDALIVATSTPDMLMPATANIVCDKLGIENVWAFDMNAACSGFLYALDMGASLIETKRYKNVLVIGADKISAYVNINDRSTNILFGDGAGVVWLEPTNEEAILDALLLSNGTGKEYLNIEGGGSLHPISEQLLLDE